MAQGKDKERNTSIIGTFKGTVGGMGNEQEIEDNNGN
jgi:hypothetical protein